MRSGFPSSLASLLVLPGLLLSNAITSTSLAGASTTMNTHDQCAKVAKADFSGVPEAPARVMSADRSERVQSNPVAAHCHITGYVTPNIGFELLLPDAWNGRFIQIGSGGHGGQTSPTGCLFALARGYACLTSDMGHRGTILDGEWAYGALQAKVDWGYRATHVAAVAGKAIVAQYYGREADRSYFAGCSTGGRQALQAAQRFPWDYDGIIAGAPPIRLADLYVTFAWGQRVLRVAGKPVLSMMDLKLLTGGALARCDNDDGLKDGIISNPLACSFEPSQLSCKNGQQNGCLGPDKVRAAEAIYSGPVDASGKSLFGGGAPPGSELGGVWNAKHGGNWGVYYQGTDGDPASYAQLTQDGFRYLFQLPEPGPDWAIDKFDFAADSKRLDVMQSLYDSSNPDLTRFRDAGGKLIIYHGYNDLSILPHWIIGYYRKVEAVVGGREAAQRFVRLFSLPGVEHCVGGAGADRADWLTAIEKWVEVGKAPERLVSYRLKPEASSASSLFATFPVQSRDIEFSRPLYPWPTEARYSGTGDEANADSFRPLAPRPVRRLTNGNASAHQDLQITVLPPVR